MGESPAAQSRLKLSHCPGRGPATVVAPEALISEGKINDKIARQVLEFVLAGEGTPPKSLRHAASPWSLDDGALTAAVQEGTGCSNARRCREIRAGGSGCWRYRRVRS